MVSVCFTGHRPPKGIDYDWKTEKSKKTIYALNKAIMDILEEVWSKDDGESITFYFGGALGIDQVAFELVNSLRKTIIKPQQINRILAMPFEKQDANWFKQEDKDRLRKHRELADEVILVDTLDDYKIKGYIEGSYYPAKMQKRNEYMVDNSDIVIAVWDGTKGGTYNCIKYAEKLGKRIIRINPKEL